MPKENPHSARVTELLQAYKIIAGKEKSEKDRKKYPMSKRRAFHFATPTPSSITSSGMSNASTSDKYGILGPINRRMRSSGQQQQQNQEQASAQSFEAQLAQLVKPASTVSNFEPLSEDYFTKAINISSSTLN